MKKAILFSFFSIFLLIFISLNSSVIVKNRSQESELELTRARVAQLNSIQSVFSDHYFEKMVQISVKNALVALSKYYYINGYPGSDDLDETLDDGLVFNGTFSDQGIVLSDGFDSNYSFYNLTRNITDLFSRLGVDVTELELIISDVTQNEPWNLTVDTELNYNLADKEGIAGWKGSIKKQVVVSVIGLYLENSSNIGGVVDLTTWCIDTTENSMKRKLSGLPIQNPSPNGIDTCW